MGNPEGSRQREQQDADTENAIRYGIRYIAEVFALMASSWCGGERPPFFQEGNRQSLTMRALVHDELKVVLVIKSMHSAYVEIDPGLVRLPDFLILYPDDKLSYPSLRTGTVVEQR